MSVPRSVESLLRPLALGGLAVALAACANPRAERAVLAQQALIGMPKQTLLSCAGVPNRTAAVDNMEFFTYRSERTVAYPATSSLGLWGAHHWHGFGHGWGFPMPLDYYGVESRSCEATFTLRNGVVERLVFGGNDGGGGSRLSQCYSIVQNCLAQVPGAGAPLSSTGAAPSG